MKHVYSTVGSASLPDFLLFPLSFGVSSILSLFGLSIKGWFQVSLFPYCHNPHGGGSGASWFLFPLSSAAFPNSLDLANKSTLKNLPLHRPCRNVDTRLHHCVTITNHACSASKPLRCKRSWTNRYTFSGRGVASIRSTLPLASKCSTTGMLVSTKVRKRLRMLSTLSSVRPDVLPRFSSRACITGSGQSKKSVNSEAQTRDSNASAWSILRGKPRCQG